MVKFILRRKKNKEVVIVKEITSYQFGLVKLYLCLNQTEKVEMIIKQEAQEIKVNLDLSKYSKKKQEMMNIKIHKRSKVKIQKNRYF